MSDEPTQIVPDEPPPPDDTPPPHQEQTDPPPVPATLPPDLDPQPRTLTNLARERRRIT